MKEKEQKFGVINRLGRGVAAVGLFLIGCGPAAHELRKDPKLTTPPTTLKSDYFHIDRISQHTFKAVGEGVFVWNFDVARDVAIQYLVNNCKVEAILPGGESRERIVIVEDGNCLPEVKW